MDKEDFKGHAMTGGLIIGHGILATSSSKHCSCIVLCPSEGWGKILIKSEAVEIKHSAKMAGCTGNTEMFVPLCIVSRYRCWGPGLARLSGKEVA